MVQENIAEVVAQGTSGAFAATVEFAFFVGRSYR